MASASLAARALDASALRNPRARIPRASAGARAPAASGRRAVRSARHQFAAAAIPRTTPRGPAPPRASADDDEEEEEDWEKLFTELKPLTPELPRYKVAILEKALARGRRRIPISKIARDLELRRDDVLAWVRANAHREPELARSHPPEPERVATVRLDRDGNVASGSRAGRNGRDAAVSSQTSYLKHAPGAADAHVPKGAPAWKGFNKTRLGATNVATLEKVYAAERYPDDGMVDSVHRATKLPRSKIVAWFKTKREEEKAAKRGGERRGGERGDERGGRGGGGGRARDGDGDGFYDRRGRDDGMRGGEMKRDGYGNKPQAEGRRDSTSGWSGGRRR